MERYLQPIVTEKQFEINDLILLTSKHTSHLLRITSINDGKIWVKGSYPGQFANYNRDTWYYPANDILLNFAAFKIK